MSDEAPVGIGEHGYTFSTAPDHERNALGEARARSYRSDDLHEQAERLKRVRFVLTELMPDNEKLVNDYIDHLAAQLAEAQAHIGEAPTTERIREAHSAMPEHALRQGANDHRAYKQGHDERCYICALLAQLAERENALRRAIFIAEHLFQMVPKEAWRESGAEYMGQYEGDHWAEQTRLELQSLAATHSDSEDTDA